MTPSRAIPVATAGTRGRTRFSLILALSLCGLFNGVTATAQVLELIADPSFVRGFRVPDRGMKEQVIRWSKETEAPVWKVAQHGSKSCVADEAFHRVRPDGFAFKDEWAWLEVRPREHEADLVLGLNALREYEGRYREPGDPWPHLYVSQRISSPGGHLAGESPNLAQLLDLPFSARFRLLYDYRNIAEGHNPRIHAAQFLFFLTIQNLNRKSAGYGDYYWFGVAFYDDREPVTGLHAMADKGSPKKKGTGKYIYNVGIQPFTDRIVASGDWVDLRGDLLPHVLAGLRESWANGYLPGSSDIADYRLGSVVTGWEIPGLNDAAVALKNLRLSATLQPAQK